MPRFNVLDRFTLDNIQESYSVGRRNSIYGPCLGVLTQFLIWQVLKKKKVVSTQRICEIQ